MLKETPPPQLLLLDPYCPVSIFFPFSIFILVLFYYNVVIPIIRPGFLSTDYHSLYKLGAGTWQWTPKRPRKSVPWVKTCLAPVESCYAAHSPAFEHPSAHQSTATHRAERDSLALEPKTFGFECENKKKREMNDGKHKVGEQTWFEQNFAQNRRHICGHFCDSDCIVNGH